tara:strand:- start:36 stop:362 length:327 start_codon:yes stop_codon:yes gene_type:complete
MKSGEIWLAEIPNSSGHEQSGKRPVYLVSKSIGDLIMAIPLTSNIDALRFSATLLVEASKINNLENDSVLLVFQMRAIDKKRLSKKIGKLKTGDIKLLVKQIKILLNL